MAKIANKKGFIMEAVEISIYDGTDTYMLEPEMLGSVKWKEEGGTTTVSTQAGEFDFANGRDKASLEIEAYLPDITWARFLQPGRYTKATDDNGGGKYVSKAGGCAGGGNKTFVVHIHPVCQKYDINDIHIYNAKPVMDSELEFNDKGDALKTNIKFNALPNEDSMRFMEGRSDVTKKVKYNPETNDWDDVS